MIGGALERLLAPRRIALCGGVWADAAAAACRAIGYRGEVWRVHPGRPCSADVRYYRSVAELPAPPDATFIAAPAREAAPIAAALARRGAGGFVCFAAGFAETGTPEGRALTRALASAAGDLPYLGPNCYGFVNFFDRAALWPDQIVGGSPERGVALICQSGTIALNLMFNRRSVPLGYVLTVGNQSRLALEDLIEALSGDPRVSAFGLYVEGIQDIERFARATENALAAGKPVALVKAGRTSAAARTVHSHTGSLAGADAAFDALCERNGIARCDTLGSLCETLKVLHAGGALPGRRVLLMGASGGDMAMAADTARSLAVEFPPLPPQATRDLRELLTDRVTLSNPFDFHTHIWFDRAKLNSLFAIAASAGFDAVGYVIDCPPADEADPASYLAVIEEFESAAARSTTRAAVISSLPESLPAPVRSRCLAAGIAPLQGQREALEALAGAAAIGEAIRRDTPVRLLRPRRAAGRADAPLGPGTVARARTLAEHEGKAALAASGVSTPPARVVAPDAVPEAAATLGYPVVIKATAAGLEHKSELGAVALDVRTPAAAAAAAERLGRLSSLLLVEKMIDDGVAEILIGITADPQFGQLLLLGAGGVLAELLADTAVLLPPFTPDAIQRALAGLKVAKLLAGYRGRTPGDVPALVRTALACARYAQQNLDSLLELDLNPVIVRPAGLGAVAVDALVRLTEDA
jgi:acyl-CoA synthetase (NDP forming)